MRSSALSTWASSFRSRSFSSISASRSEMRLASSSKSPTPDSSRTVSWMPRLLVAIRDSMVSRSALSRSWKRRMSFEFSMSRPPIVRPRKPRLPAEVSLLDLGISPEGGTGAAEEDAACLDDVGAVRDLERAQRVLLDQQNRDAIVVDLLDDVEHGVHHLRRQAQRGFVEQKELRLRQQAAGDGEDLLLATRELAGRKVPALAEDCKLLHQSLDVAMRGAAVATRPRPELEVLEDGQTSQDLASLRYLDQALANDPIGRRGHEVERAEARDARMRAQYARQGIEDGRLAGPVRANQRDDLSLGDAERNAAHRLDGAVGNLEIAHVEQRRGGFGCCRGRRGGHVHFLRTWDMRRRLLRLASAV